MLSSSVAGNSESLYPGVALYRVFCTRQRLKNSRLFTESFRQKTTAESQVCLNMTGWLGVDSVTSCCCCELCQPVRCVIDQHEVEIVPATYRSTSSSVGPTTHRTHWSTSSSNTLQSSRTLISEGSIPRPRTRQLRLGEPAAYCTGTVDPHSVVRTTPRRSSHVQPQGANRAGSHNRHMSALAAGTPPHQQREQQSTPRGSLKTVDQECSRSRRLPGAGKKLRTRKSLRVEAKEKEHRVKTEAGKCLSVPSRRGSSRATCSDQPFHLFEQDPQHDASFPEDCRAIQPEEKEGSVLVGAAFASREARTRGNAPGGAVDFLPLAGECPDRSRQCDADVNSYVSVACNHIACNEEDNRSVCRHPATSFPASRIFRAVQVPHLVLNEPQLSRQLLVYSGGQQQQRTPDISCWASSHSAGSVRAAYPADETSVHCNTPIWNDKENSAVVSTGRDVESSCRCPAAARQGVTKEEDDSRQSGDTAEDGTAAVSADLHATMRKNHACDHMIDIQVKENLSCAYKGSTTAAPDTVEGERGTAKCIRAKQSKGPSRVLEGPTDTGETSSVEMVCDTVSRGRIPFCSSWNEWKRGAARVQTALSCEDTSYFHQDRQTGGVAGGSRPAHASAFGGACATTYSGSSHNLQEKEFRTREPPPRGYYPWFTKFPPDCGIFFYDSSIGCADGLGTVAVAAAGDCVASDDESFAAATGPGSAVRIDTQNVGTFCSKERTSCVARHRPQLQPQVNAPTQMQHAAFTHSTRDTANLRGRSQQPSFCSRAHCPPRPAFDEAQGEQQAEPDPRFGRTAADPDGVTVDAVSHAHRHRKHDCQQRHETHQADRNVKVLLENEHQRARKEQQRQEGNETCSERRRGRAAPAKMHLLFHSDEVIEETGEAEPRKRCQSAKRFVVNNAAQHNADVESALLPLENIPPTPRIDKRTKQVCLFPAHLEGRPMCENRFEDGSRDARSAVAADSKCASRTHDVWRLRRNQVTAGDETTLEECVTAESRGSSNLSATASLYCVSPSSVSIQGKATAAQLRTEVVGSGVCYGLTSTLCSLMASLITSALPEEASQQLSAHQQQEQCLYTAWQQRDRLAQQQGKGAMTSSDDPDGYTLPAQPADGASLSTSPAKTEETTGTRLVLLPSSFSAQVSGSPTRRGSSLARKCRIQHISGETDPHCDNGTYYIRSKISGTRDCSRCVCVGGISSTESVGSDRSRSNWNAVGVTTFNRRSRECRRESRDGRLIYNVSTNTESSAGNLQSPAIARQSSSLKRNDSSATRRSVGAHLTSGCNTANLTSYQTGDTAATVPLPPNTLLRRCREPGQPSKKTFGGSRMKELVSTPVHKYGSTHQSPSARNHCFEDRMAEPVSPAVTPGLTASHTVVDVARNLNRHSCVSSLDRDTLLPLQQKKAQEPRETEVQEKEQSNDEDSHIRLRGKRFLRSKVKCSDKEMGQGLLSKGARLVLWQAKTNESPPVAPAQLMVS